MKQSFTILFAAGSLLLATTVAQAQTTFRIGPKMSYLLSTAAFNVVDYPDYFTTPSSFRSGFEAGVVAQVGVSSHFAVQPAVLYARRGLGFGTHSYYQPNNYSYKEDYTMGLNYLLVPVNLLYSQRPNGRGGQVFAGPYVGWLLGGTYQSLIGSATGMSVPSGLASSGNVKAGDTYATSFRDNTYYMRRLDAGLQVGVGYGFEALQLQASFSLGLRDVGAGYVPNAGYYYEPPVIRHRGFQLSAAYLFGPKS
jgi:hypothetical protein